MNFSCFPITLIYLISTASLLSYTSPITFLYLISTASFLHTLSSNHFPFVSSPQHPFSPPHALPNTSSHLYSISPFTHSLLFTLIVNSPIKTKPANVQQHIHPLPPLPPLSLSHAPPQPLLLNPIGASAHHCADHHRHPQARALRRGTIPTPRFMVGPQ